MTTHLKPLVYLALDDFQHGFRVEARQYDRHTGDVTAWLVAREGFGVWNHKAGHWTIEPPATTRAWRDAVWVDSWERALDVLKEAME